MYLFLLVYLYDAGSETNHHVDNESRGEGMTQLESYRYVIVGAGMWGAVLAERLASVSGERVLVIDKRNHTGGNCHSHVDAETGIECHSYGSHIFHTKRKRVWDYLTGFTGFNNYRHRVLTEYNGKLYPMPICLETVNAFYGISLKPFEARAFIEAEAAREGLGGLPANLEEKAISLIGRPLYEAFIKGYTRKQWQKDPRELPAEIITRLPVRTNYITDYFDDPWQGIPLCGYYGLFDRLLDHENISVRLNVDFNDIRDALSTDTQIFYSGPIDEFYGYSLGRLEWRSLRFETEHKAHEDWQGAACINQADERVPYTRTHEFRHYHPERQYGSNSTVIVREYPQDYTDVAERYYPINTEQNQKLHREYLELAAVRNPEILFGGRLGSYRYIDMDAAVDMALDVFEETAATRAARN